MRDGEAGGLSSAAVAVAVAVAYEIAAEHVVLVEKRAIYGWGKVIKNLY